MLDYIVVGLGLSGLSVCDKIQKRGKSLVVFEDGSQRSSYVAGGIFNPVILKRFTPAWNAAEQMRVALPFYGQLEKDLKLEFVHEWNIYRRFHSIEEQNNWFVARDRPGVADFLDGRLVKNSNDNLNAPFSLGKVLHTGNIDTETLLNEYNASLSRKGILKNESFDYSALKFADTHIEYQEIKAKRIIFCEGFGLKRNPFFDYLPMRGNKGEYIIIRSRELKLDFAVKGSVFLMPLGNDLYKVGATYDHKDKTPTTTMEARERLSKEVERLINCDFEVVDQVAGIRPAVSDRKPLVGQHPEKARIYCCNGFGSRGVLIAPVVAEALLELIENDVSLDPEIDLHRFTRKHYIKN